MMTTKPQLEIPPGVEHRKDRQQPLRGSEPDRECPKTTPVAESAAEPVGGTLPAAPPAIAHSPRAAISAIVLRTCHVGEG